MSATANTERTRGSMYRFVLTSVDFDDVAAGLRSRAKLDGLNRELDVIDSDTLSAGAILAELDSEKLPFDIHRPQWRTLRAIYLSAYYESVAEVSMGTWR